MFLVKAIWFIVMALILPSTLGANQCYGDPVCSGHGTCLPFTDCVCDPGYAGMQCEYNATCNGLTQQQGACSWFGLCIAEDTCDCPAEYSGTWCEIPRTCNGTVWNSTEVCNTNGICFAQDYCMCFDTFYGEWCADGGLNYTCYGKAPEMKLGVREACGNYRGNCTQQDTCVCIPGYSGPECMTWSCYGVNNTDPNVCDGNTSHSFCVAPDTCSCNLATMDACYMEHGTCISPVLCQCDIGYGSNFDGKPCGARIPCTSGTPSPGSSFACNSTGSWYCQIDGDCHCKDGYWGIDCSDIARCKTDYQEEDAANGYFNCGAHGCNDTTGDCICLLGYFGRTCEASTCFGISSNNTISCNATNCYGYDPLPCSGKGFCFGPDRCGCLSGIGGSQCERPAICFGIETATPGVCNGHGICDGDNYCICDSGYRDKLFLNLTTNTPCTEFTCFDNPWSPCHTPNGTCVAPDTCDCVSGYTGNTCGIPICNGISATDPTVCSSNGVCVAPNTCLCNLGRVAPLCTCPTGYSGTECDIWSCGGIFATNESVCSSYGNCVSPNTCQCDTGYSGTSCNSWSCASVSRVSPTVCGGKGNCTAPDQCSCITGFYGSTCNDWNCGLEHKSSTTVCTGRGTCTKPDLCTCNIGFGGNLCEITTPDVPLTVALTSLIIVSGISVPLLLAIGIAFFITAISYMGTSRVKAQEFTSNLIG